MIRGMWSDKTYLKKWDAPKNCILISPKGFRLPKLSQNRMLAIRIKLLSTLCCTSAQHMIVAIMTVSSSMELPKTKGRNWGDFNGQPLNNPSKCKQPRGGSNS